MLSSLALLGVLVGVLFGDLSNVSEKRAEEVRDRIASGWLFSREYGIGDLDFCGRRGAGIATLSGIGGAG